MQTLNESSIKEKTTHELLIRAKELDRRLLSLTDSELAELNLIKETYYNRTGMRIYAKTLRYV